MYTILYKASHVSGHQDSVWPAMSPDSLARRRLCQGQKAQRFPDEAWQKSSQECCQGQWSHQRSSHDQWSSHDGWYSHGWSSYSGSSWNEWWSHEDGSRQKESDHDRPDHAHRKNDHGDASHSANERRDAVMTDLRLQQVPCTDVSENVNFYTCSPPRDSYTTEHRNGDHVGNAAARDIRQLRLDCRLQNPLYLVSTASADVPSEGEIHDLSADMRYTVVHSLDLGNDSVDIEGGHFSVFTIELFYDAARVPCNYAFLVAPPRGNCLMDHVFEFRLPGCGLVVRVARAAQSLVVKTASEAGTLRDHHWSMVRDLSLDDTAGAAVSRTPFLVVRLKSGKSEGAPLQLALEEMEERVRSSDLEKELPIWLIPVMPEFHELYHIGLAFQLHSPVQPAPNPSTVRSAVSSVLQSGRGPRFHALEALGSSAVAVLLAAALYKRWPCDHALRLEQHFTQLLEHTRLALLMERSNVLAFVSVGDTRIYAPSGRQVETMAGAFFALIGAYFNEPGGGFYSVARLWSWLDEEVDFLDLVAGSFFGSLETVSGRTVTHETFQEIDFEGESVLVVGCVKDGVPEQFQIAFRRAKPGVRPFAEEVRIRSCDGHWSCDGEWTPIHFDACLGAYISCVVRNHLPNEVTYLPNKVTITFIKYLLAKTKLNIRRLVIFYTT